MFARFDENPAMTLRVIKETKRYGRTDGRTDARTDNVKTVYPLQTKFAGGIKIHPEDYRCARMSMQAWKESLYMFLKHCGLLYARWDTCRTSWLKLFRSSSVKVFCWIYNVPEVRKSNANIGLSGRRNLTHKCDLIK